MYTSFYFVRHAESLHNERATLVKNQNNLGKNADISKIPEYREVKYGPAYFDCGITVQGYEECALARQECKDLNIGLVLTSPLSRAIVSACEVFKGHKDAPKVIIEPLLGERMTSACDLGTLVRQSMEKFPDYNYTQLVDKGIVDTWYIENLSEARRAVLYDKIKEREAKDSDAIGKVVLEELQKNVYLESKKELENRIGALKVKLKEYLTKTDKKIAIVGHSNMIKTLTATGFRVDGEPINGVDMKNCEVDLINVVLDMKIPEKPAKGITMGRT